MKKIIAYALTLSMLVLYAIPMYAASGGWTVSYLEPSTSANPIDKDTEFVEITTLDSSEYTDGVSGKVMHTKFAREHQADTLIYIENSLSDALVKNSRYNFSFYAKGTFDITYICVGIGTSEYGMTSGAMISLFDTDLYTVTDKGNGWKQYEFANKKYDDTGNHFGIMILAKCDDLYIDNISLMKKSTTDELIIDGGFEDTDFAAAAKEDIGNQAGYAPKNLIATNKTEHIMLSWQNPDNSSLSKVSLYDITTGEEIKIIDTLSKAPNDYVNYDVTGLVAGSKHTYKVVFDFGKTTTTEAVISGVATYKTESTSTDTWMVGNHPGTAYIEHDETHAGEGALRLISNKKSWEGNNYIRTQTNSIPFNDSKEYEISMWVNGRFAGTTGINYSDAIKDDTPSKFKYNGESTTFNVVETDANGWKNVVFRINGAGAKAIAIMGEARTDILVDDIEVYEVVNNARGTKLFSQDFESLTNTVPDVTALSGEVGRSMAKINFTAPAGAYKVRVYVKDGDNLSKRAEVYPENNIVTFSHLKNDNNYTYVVKVVDDYNNESEGQEITLTPAPQDWECLEYGLYNYGVAINSIDASQTYTAKATIKNNKVDAGVNAQIIAILRKDGERIDADASSVTSISKTSYDEDGTDITASIVVPADISDGKYEISVYLWDELDTMTVLRPFKIYKEPTE